MPSSGPRLELDGGVEHLAEPLHDRQPDALAALLADGARVGRGPGQGGRAARLGFHLLRLVRRLLDGSRERRARPGVEAGPGVRDLQHPAVVVVRAGRAPGHGDAAFFRVLQRVQQQVLGDALDLDDVALDRERVRAARLQVEAALLREVLPSLAQASDQRTPRRRTTSVAARAPPPGAPGSSRRRAWRATRTRSSAGAG